VVCNQKLIVIYLFQLEPPHDRQGFFSHIIDYSADCPPTITLGTRDKMTKVRGDPWLIQVLTPVAVLVSAVVGVRFALRLSRRAGFWFDDWFILASLVLVWGMYAVSVLDVEIGGIGTPFKDNLDADPSMAWLVHCLKVNPDTNHGLNTDK
jgi:hypothetical protein